MAYLILAPPSADDPHAIVRDTHMPLIEIQMLPGPDREALERIAQRVSAEVAAAVGARANAVWTTWRSVDGYAVGPDLAARQPAGSHAPIVHVYARRTPAEVEKICAVIEAGFGEELGLDPFVTVQPVISHT
jgi:phenylpyruvate tautomerase PptA (4-oxalocrotonate tautomerase family)